jgi:hypothetical protein
MEKNGSLTKMIEMYKCDIFRDKDLNRLFACAIGIFHFATQLP